MKYAIIIPDGAADFPVNELDGQTPLEAANTPRLDALAMAGRQGTVRTTPDGMSCGSDVCTMSLLGYDPKTYHTGRAPLEAAALGIDLQPGQWVFRVNLVTIIDQIMADHSAGHIRSAEGRQLIEDFVAQADLSKLEGIELLPGVSYRNLMIDRSSRDWSELRTTPPHDIPGRPIDKHLPVGGPRADLLTQLIHDSHAILAEHEVNQTRQEMGESPATHLWPWGQGTRPQMPSFDERFGLRGAMITAVDLLAGLSRFIGWDRLEVPGQTSYHDTDYAAAGQYAHQALDDYDLICVHVEAPDEAAHAADPRTKVEAIECIDAQVIGPLHDALQARDHGNYRMLIMPDHYTRIDTRKHDPTPVPFVMSGTNVRSALGRPLSEQTAHDADLHITHGHELMEYFLHSGLS